MKAILFFVLGFLVLTLCSEAESANGECPSVRDVYSCAPKCLQNYDCANGKLCCPNKCNTKSCVESKTSGWHGSYGASGYVCKHLKCNSRERCILDPSTKREKCVRD